ncbi:MAG: CBS domain-containing protein [Myxococcota bacterium]|nr:CBS domain-containing protein [Myxococcota bacterium]
MNRISVILQRRSPVVHTLSPDATVSEAVSLMAEEHVGIVPVVERWRLVGVFSERDLLRRVVAQNRSTETTTLREVMTPDPVTAVPEEDRSLAISKMGAAGCRHLPIMSGPHVIDMFSMRELLADEVEDRGTEIGELRRYIHGGY